MVSEIPLAVPNFFVVEHCVFNNERGLFLETFNHAQIHEAVGRSVPFVQSGHRCSMRSVFYGLHRQTHQSQGKPFTQAEIFA